MLATRSSSVARRIVLRATSSSRRTVSNQTHHSSRTPQELDPALVELLNTSSDALKGLRHKSHPNPKEPVELHVYDDAPAELAEAEESSAFEIHDRREERRSPAAVLGSDRPAHIHISEELQEAITSLVEKTDKHQLRSDAKRLFLNPSPSSTDLRWETKTPHQGTKTNEMRLAARTGLAYATVALPAQCAAITSVLRETKLRIGEENLDIQQVIDFGAKAGGGLWAARDEFGDLKHYMGLDNRAGMVAMAETLIHEAGEISTRTQFQKFWGRSGRKLPVSSDKSIALCAFSLSELKTDLDRQQMLREMWSTGAEYMIVIDHGTKDGFQSVGDARDYFLRKGRKEVKSGEASGVSASNPTPNTIGSHVVAPCPHDRACPLHSLIDDHSRRKAAALQRKGKSYKSTPEPTLQRVPDPAQTMGPTSTCHFTQRLSRPNFVRKTKHAHKAHEDILFSYVVVRRGQRPVSNGSEASMRIGGVGREQLAKDAEKERKQEGGSAVAVEVDDVFHYRGREDGEVELEAPSYTAADMTSLRNESYSWPRVIYPPLKRSGHIILDACTDDGNISRITIPKSQGKQAYHDARKASWGDIFPHEPKNGLEIRKRGREAVSDQPEDNEQEDVEDEEDEKEFFDSLKSFQQEFGWAPPKGN